MQRYFISNEQFLTQEAHLTGADFHHLKHVMRGKLQDQVIVCNDNGICFYAHISSIKENEIVVKLGETVPSTDLIINVDLAQAMIRRERFEYVLQKSTELGVRTIIPVMMTNSIIKWDIKKEARKLERYNDITKEASEQSHRCTKATVVEPLELKELPFHHYDLILVAYEKEHNSRALSTLLQTNYSSILLVIGPEGGFTMKEIEFLSTIEHAHFVGLGKRILRSETASSYLLSVIGYEYELRERQ